LTWARIRMTNIHGFYATLIAQLARFLCDQLLPEQYLK
jgi:hypothetical protein